MLAARVAVGEGLTVLTTTRDKQKEKLLLDHGASQVLVDDGLLSEKIRMNFPEGVDKVLELVGASTLKDSLKCLSPGGTACMSGMLSETWTIPEFEPMEFIPATVRLTVYDSGEVRSPVSVFQKFIESVESGQMKVKPSRVFQLDQIVNAHECMENNLADGKIVVLTE
jgi:NADPH:quinone reductase-like Zn-dependent oxidoreductase